MKSTYSVTEAQANLPQILKDAQEGSIAIQRHNETVAYIISRSRMEAIGETLEILANPEAMDTIRRAQANQIEYLPLSALDED